MKEKARGGNLWKIEIKKRQANGVWNCIQRGSGAEIAINTFT